jgi:peptide/nickel transport system substrate-binding protein
MRNLQLGTKRRPAAVLVTVVAALVVVGLAAVGAAVLASPSAAESPSASPSGAVTLRVGWTTEPDNLNPCIGYESSSWELWHLNYDFLVGFSAEDMTPVPELATSWSSSDDGTVWTFELRDDVTWQDGEPFTAADVVFTYRFLIDNEVGNFAAYYGFIDEVTAVDDYTVEFRCSKPKANMLSQMVYILPEHIWAEMDPKKATTSFANKPPIVGTGPFQVVEWKRGEYLRLEANEGYWKGVPKVDEIIVSYYTNPDAMVEDLRQDTIQLAWAVPDARFPQLEQQSGITAVKAYVNGYSELGFNCYEGKASQGSPVLRDPAFRQALQYAVDKEAIAGTAFFGNARPATTIIPSDFYPSDSDYHWEPPADVAYSFDLEKAKAALDEAGYADSDGDGIRNDPASGDNVSLRLYARTQSTQEQNAAKMIAGSFQDVGLDIDYQVLDQGALTDKMYTYDDAGEFAPDYDMFIWYWHSDPDPDWALGVLTTGQIEYWSDSNWSNAEYDSLYEQQQTQVDTQARVDTIHQMQQMVYEESPYIPLVYLEWLQAYNSADWTGWVRAPADTGGVTRNIYNIDSYVQVQLATAEAEESGASNAWIWIVVIVAVAAVAVVAVLLRRGRGKAEEA